MKNSIFLDTGVIGLYQSKNREIIKEIDSKRNKKFSFMSSELNYIELFNHLCREKGLINAQIIMENLRRGTIVKFFPLSENTSILAGELKCRYDFLSIVDAIICAEALSRNIFIYTTESRLKEVKNLKFKKIDY